MQIPPLFCCNHQNWCGHLDKMRVTIYLSTLVYPHFNLNHTMMKFQMYGIEQKWNACALWTPIVRSRGIQEKITRNHSTLKKYFVLGGFWCGLWVDFPKSTRKTSKIHLLYLFASVRFLPLFHRANAIATSLRNGFCTHSSDVAVVFAWWKQS